ncbi:NAD-dependent succinate-semialdehyde dehydrogenase [Halotalea alkalilenta]|uniref:NAD-dependent succinate-semialdehyde dehydrogenase n=1 Tax=Halotalea alkalilenta TaxID=376489 RepID=A0A172YFU1_9GAMM|nr:NAD-dependent succinate-semialdehyde dehydrogenase [Halotalea alkalilenta]ANF57835.1 NAD-dependent succinate-semialdehyde dehydrogenase [Halotalea alkalilenta]
MYADLGLFINGRLVNIEGGDRSSVHNPANDEVIGSFPNASVSDLDDALASAERAFSTWKNSSPLDRNAVLHQVAMKIRQGYEPIARKLTLEQGKPFAEAVAEVLSCAEHADWHAQECRRIYGRVIPARDSSVQQVVIREPVGVCVAFSPWNFPFSQAFRKVVAAIGAGCTLILKGSSDTPASVLEIAKLFHDAGLPDGVLNVVSGDSSMISEYLIASPIIKKISFTGSTPIGKRLASLAGAHMKKCSMELGGHAPVIVCDDADIDNAVKRLVPFKFRNAGQVCISPSRFYVQANVYEEFLDKFAKLASGIKVGPGWETNSTMGPLVHARRIQEMEEFVDDAKRFGARIALGGTRHGSAGNYFDPTVIADVPEHAKLMTDEPFGPVAGIAPFQRVEDAVASANSLPYGLASYAFTTSIENSHFISRSLEAGMVSINHIGLALAETPFGGVKDSGYGREGGAETFDDYLTSKFITQK